MASFSSKYISLSNGDCNPSAKQRGYAITSEHGGPLDTAEWSLTYPGDDWPNMFPGKLVYVFDEDEYYYADSNLIWHPIGDLVGEDIGNDDVYFDIDFTVTGGVRDSRYGHTWVFNHNAEVTITPHVAVQIGGKSVRIEGMDIAAPPSLSDIPVNSEVRTSAPFIVTAGGFRANNDSKVVRAGIIPCEVTTTSGLHITGRLKYAINPSGSADTYEKFIQDVSSRMLYLRPDTPELQKGFIIASESGGALDMTGYTSMNDADFTNPDRGLKPWDESSRQELTNMYLGKRIYNYDPQSPEKSSFYRYSYNAGNNLGEDRGKRFDVNFYEYGLGIAHGMRILNWWFHNPFLFDRQWTQTAFPAEITPDTNLDVIRPRMPRPQNFVAPNWVKFGKNDNNKGKIKDYRVMLSFDEKSGYAHINLNSWGVYDGSALRYYKWNASNTGHGTSIGVRLPGQSDSFSERRYVTASLVAQFLTPGSSAWSAQTLLQDESRFKWTGTMRYAPDNAQAHPSAWSASDSVTSTGSVFPSASAASGRWDHWLENMTFLRKYVDLELTLNSDISGVSSLSYVKKTVLGIEVEPMFSSSLIQMSAARDFSTVPSQIFLSGTREHSTQKIWFRMVPRLKETNTVYAQIAQTADSDMTAVIETPAGMTQVSLKREGVNLYSVPVDTYNLAGASANWIVRVSGRFKDSDSGIPGGDTVQASFLVTVSAKPVDYRIRFFSDIALTNEVSGISRRGNENGTSVIYATLWDGQVRLSNNVTHSYFVLSGTATQVLDPTVSNQGDGIFRISLSPKETAITSDKDGDVTITLTDSNGEATGSLPVTVTIVGYTMKFRMFSSPDLSEGSALTGWISKNEMFNLISNIPQYPDPAVRDGYSKWDGNKEVFIAARVENDDNPADVSGTSGPGSSQYWTVTVNDKHRSPLTDLTADATFSMHSSYYHKTEILTATWKPYAPVWEARITPELYAGAAIDQTEFVIKFRDRNDAGDDWYRAGSGNSIRMSDHHGNTDPDAEFTALSYEWAASGHSGFVIRTGNEDNTSALSMPAVDSEEDYTLRLGCTATLRHVTDTGEMYKEPVFDDTVLGHEAVIRAHPEQISPVQEFFTWTGQGDAHILFFPSTGYTDGDGTWASVGTASGDFDIRMSVKGYNLDLADDTAVRGWFNAGIWTDWNFGGIAERTGSTEVIVRLSTKSPISTSKSWEFTLAESGSSVTLYATAVRPARPTIWTPWIFLDGNQKWKSNDGTMRRQGDSTAYQDGYRFVLCDWSHEMRMDIDIDRTAEAGFAKWRSDSVSGDSVYKYLGVTAEGEYSQGGGWTPDDTASGSYDRIGSCRMLENEVEFSCTLPDRGLRGGVRNLISVKSVPVDWRYWMIILRPFGDITETAWNSDEFSINTEYTWRLRVDEEVNIFEFRNEGQGQESFSIKLRPTNTSSRDGVDRNWWTGDVALTGNRFSSDEQYKESFLELVPISSGLKEQPQLRTTLKQDCQGNEYYRAWIGHPLCWNVTAGTPNWSAPPSVYSGYFLSQSSYDPDYEYPLDRDGTTPRNEKRLTTLPYGYVSFTTSDSVEPSITSLTYSVKSCSNPDIETDTTGTQPYRISDKIRYYHDVSILTGWSDAAYRTSYCAHDSGHETEYWRHTQPGPNQSPYVRGSVEFTSDWVQVDITVNIGTMAVPAWARTASTKASPYCTLKEVDNTEVNLGITPYYGLTGSPTRTGHVAPLGSLGDADMTWAYPYDDTGSSLYEAAYSDHRQRIATVGNYTGKSVLSGSQFRGSGYKIVERTAPQVSGKNISLSYLVKPNVCTAGLQTVNGFTQCLKTSDETWVFEINLGAGKMISASLDIPIYMKQFGSGKFEIDSVPAEDTTIGSEVAFSMMIGVADDVERCRDYVESSGHPQIPRYNSDYSTVDSDIYAAKVPSGGYMTLEFVIDDGYDEYNGDRNADSTAEIRSHWSDTISAAGNFRTWKRRFTLPKLSGSDDFINSGEHTVQMIASIFDAAGNLQSVAVSEQPFKAMLSEWNSDGDNDGTPADLALVTADFGTK